MNLVIVESPSKAKTIAKYLGEDYRVTASGGHINDLPQRRLGIDIEKDFEPEYEINEQKVTAINKMKKDCANAEKIYLATDPDREGEAISWHLKNVLGIKDELVRIEFNEISKKAVNNAIKTPRKINLNLVDAQQARRVLDRIVGYKVSPIISRKIKSGLSAGRVQSVALKMIVDREKEIRAFKPEEYWNIFALIKKANDTGVYKTAFNDIDGKKCKVNNQKMAEEIEQKSLTGKWSIDSIKKMEFKSKPNPPFTTSTMQQDAAHKLGFSSPQVMQIAQQLYEGIEIEGEGHLALVTYIRTDSVRISEDAQQDALQYIKQNFGKDYAPTHANVYKTNKSAQDAHEAIRPISLDRTPDSLKDKIQRNQYKLYKLVYERFLASQMTNATYDTLTVHITSDNVKKYGYVLKGKTLTFAGYQAVYSNVVEDDDSDSNVKMLPKFEKDDSIVCDKIDKEQKFTKPPQRFNDATLVKGMEENGIGRPSTYATIIMVLAKRNYTEKDGKNIVPTELGEVVCDQLVKFFPDIMDAKFTAHMESQLDQVEEGLKWQVVLREFYPEFHNKVLAAMNDSQKVKLKEEVTDVICEKCGAHMIVKDGRYGKFLACPNFPECKNIKPYGEFVAKCPKCGSGILKKISKKGKVFFTCSAYPKCDFISWDIPAPYYCPECQSIMKMVTSNDQTKYICTNKNCKHTELKTEPTTKPDTDNN
ncbi:MAG: type I DNA topoisomerase [Clostridia bacterium]